MCFSASFELRERGSMNVWPCIIGSHTILIECNQLDVYSVPPNQNYLFSYIYVHNISCVCKTKNLPYYFSHGKCVQINVPIYYFYSVLVVYWFFPYCKLICIHKSKFDLLWFFFNLNNEFSHFYCKPSHFPISMLEHPTKTSPRGGDLYFRVLAAFPCCHICIKYP